MKKTLILILSAVLLASSATACGNDNKSEGNSGNYIYGQIDSISGNDMILLLADYNENAEESNDSDDDKSDDDSESKRGSRNRPEGSDGEMPEGFDPSKFNGEKPEGFDGEMPEGFDPSKFGGKRPEGSDGEMPEGFDPSKFNGEKPEGFDGEMPEGFDPSQFGGEKPEGFSRGDGSGRRPGGSRNSKYNLTGEQEEFLIPVGTVVTTDSGTETDFSTLEKGDMIKCDISKDSDGNSVINSIWIVE